MLVSALQQCESAIITHISPSSWTSSPSPHPTSLSHHRAPGWAPCVIQQLLTSSLFYGASLVAHMGKNLPAMQATQSIPGLGRCPLHMIVNICWCYFLHSSHSLPPPLCLQVHSLHLCLHSFPENRVINFYRFHERTNLSQFWWSGWTQSLFHRVK